ncbi:hypothetical protein [Luteolibacter soli]|uniref:DUF4034 domain-containing protein n=1 Tax=Luteolibacter soli TaxID=3135280 RepID=A0ABU9AR40_9BACT
MKSPVQTAVTTMAVAAIIGTAWYQSRVLATERSRLSSLRQQVEAATSTPSAAVPAPATGRPDKSSQSPTPPKKTAPAIVLNEERLQLIRDLASSMEVQKGIAGLRTRSDDAMLAIGAMSNAEFRRYLKAVLACSELTEAERKDHCKFAFFALLDRRPADALTLYTESDDWARLGVPPVFVSRAFQRWTTEDLPGALAWLRETIAERPEMIEETDKGQVVYAVAKTDPVQALSMITEFGINPPSNSTQSVIGVADTPEKRLKALEALRAYLPTIQDKGDRNQAGDYAVAVLGRQLAKDGVEAGTQWADSVGLTASEAWSLGSDIGDAVRPGEEAQWIAWFDSKLEDKYCGRPIRHIMGYWAKRDHKAAATWLNDAPAGAAKNAAVARFAETVSEVEPESAAQWAETLPPGTLRTKTLTEVYCNWPKESEASKAAARAFAEKNGLDP